MKKIPNHVANKMATVAKTVISDLKSKGYIVPIKHADGNIQYDRFIVVKMKNGCYQVKNKLGKVYADQLNLPQTAVVIAHNLALGNLPSDVLIILDRNYGYRSFDEELYRTAVIRNSNDLDKQIFYQTQYEIAHERKNRFKSQIMKSFRKLTAIA
jgi:hypothetical protein